MGKVEVAFSIALLALLFALFGCGSANHSQPTPGGPGPAMPGSQTGPVTALPAPSTLHTASYIKHDLLQLGSAYSDQLPHHRVNRADTDGVFTPDWQAPGGNFDDLAYATYQFQLDDFDLNPTLRLTWAQTGQFSEGWVAFANFTNDRWDWFALPGEGSLEFDPAQHISPEGIFYAAAVLTGTAQWRLRQLEIGVDGENDWTMYGHDARHTRRSP